MIGKPQSRKKTNKIYFSLQNAENGEADMINDDKKVKRIANFID